MKNGVFQDFQVCKKFGEKSFGQKEVDNQNLSVLLNSETKMQNNRRVPNGLSLQI